MASMRDIKRRKESIQSTEQITKAMKLVSTVKLQKAKSVVEESRPYYEMMYDTICSVLRKTQGAGEKQEKWREQGKPEKSEKKALIVITSNRGLAGGYNNNLVRLVLGSKELTPENTCIYAIGRKGRDLLAGKGYEIAGDYSDLGSEPSYRETADLAELVLKELNEEKIGGIYLAYTSFHNTVTQIPKLIRLFPAPGNVDKKKQEVPVLMNYDPDEETVLAAMIPKYMSCVIYGALLEAAASENGARMTAMDSATSNAEEMIEELGLAYNRARQGAITQELTEIIAGASTIA